MQRFQYKVIPAPRRGEKAKGAKTTEDRFAVALTQIMNEMGAEGWEYLRADTLPCDERVGLTGSKTTYQNMLVFRRPLSLEEIAPQAEGAGATPPVVQPTGSALRVVSTAEAPPPRALGAATPTEGAAPKLGAPWQERAAE